MSKTKYQCTGSKISWLKPPEGVTVKCEATSSIVSPGTKCTVECDTGAPNYKELECKNVGWRPTKEVACEGVNPGVIIGVLAGGLVAVIIIAVIYAKYKQRKKKKLGLPTKVQSGKISQNGRRPGASSGRANTPQGGVNISSVAMETKHATQQPPPEGSRHSTDNEKSKRRPHHKSSNHRDVGDTKQYSRSQYQSKESHHHKKNKREYSSKHQTPVHQPAYNPNYQSDNTGQVAMAQVGYHNGAYYQHGQPQVGYGTNEPVMGYTSYNHPPSYPSRTYNVPT